MEIFYYIVFGILSAVVALLELGRSSKDRVATSSAFTSFKNNYLVVYSLMMGMFTYLLSASFNFS
jgi:MFS transporter, MFS domain-containing protein family, molybdate-anion transporter